MTCPLLLIFQFISKGVTPSLRPRMWRLSLGLSAVVTENETKTYQNLRKKCDKYDFLTDELFLLDVMNVADDHRFFPFGDAVKEIVLCFSRDRTNSLYDIHGSQKRKDKKRNINDNIDFDRNGNDVNSMSNNDKDGNEKICDNNYNYNYNSNEIDCNYNLSDNKLHEFDNDCEYSTSSSEGRGIQPFSGFSNYFAPLCYLYDERSTLYSTANRMWDMLWCRLNVICSDRGTLLNICKTFENLLTFLNPKLFLHLLSLNLQPLRVAFSWIQMAFVGFIEVDQLLILWDRILGFSDLTLFSLLATSIFMYRSEALLSCSSKEKAILILNEGSSLKVIPLLQMILFCEN